MTRPYKASTFSLEELHRRKKLEKLIFTIVDGAILLDINLRIELTNPVACQIFDWDSETIQGKYIEECLPLSIKKEFVNLLHKVVRNTNKLQRYQNQELSAPLLHKNNNKVVRILITPILDYTQNTLQGITITIQDISKEIELNEIKSQFISNISHELRTPLFNIQSFLETLLEYNNELSNKQKMEFLCTARKETHRLTRLVNDVLNLSKLESSYKYLFEPVDIQIIATQLIKAYQLTAQEKNIFFTLEIEKNLPMVIGNYDLLFQVISNLIDNALKFSYIYSNVSIRIFTDLKQSNKSYRFFPRQQQNSCIRVEISDTGIGIIANKQKFIFDRFSRLENKVHTLEGTGLGLSIVKNIIQKHLSEIYVKSEILAGTTFWFDLKQASSFNSD